MTGHVLEISNYETPVMTARQPRPGARAQIYRFPARTPLTESELDPQDAPDGMLRTYVRLHLAMDAAIGLFVCLVWYGWHQLR